MIVLAVFWSSALGNFGTGVETWPEFGINRLQLCLKLSAAHDETDDNENLKTFAAVITNLSIFGIDKSNSFLFIFLFYNFLSSSALCTIAAFYLETICLIVLISQPDSNCNLMRKIIFVMKVKKFSAKSCSLYGFIVFKLFPGHIL